MPQASASNGRIVGIPGSASTYGRRGTCTVTRWRAKTSGHAVVREPAAVGEPRALDRAARLPRGYRTPYTVPAQAEPTRRHEQEARAARSCARRRPSSRSRRGRRSTRRRSGRKRRVSAASCQTQTRSCQRAVAVDVGDRVARTRARRRTRRGRSGASPAAPSPRGGACRGRARPRRERADGLHEPGLVPLVDEHRVGAVDGGRDVELPRRRPRSRARGRRCANSRSGRSPWLRTRLSRDHASSRLVHAARRGRARAARATTPRRKWALPWFQSETSEWTKKTSLTAPRSPRRPRRAVTRS